MFHRSIPLWRFSALWFVSTAPVSGCVAELDAPLIDDEAIELTGCTPTRFECGPDLLACQLLDVPLSAACPTITIEAWGGGGGPGACPTKGKGGGGAYVRLEVESDPAYASLRLRPGGNPAVVDPGGRRIYASQLHWSSQATVVNWMTPQLWGPMLLVAGGGGSAGCHPTLPVNGGAGGRDGADASGLARGGKTGSSTAPGAGGAGSDAGWGGRAGTGPGALIPGYGATLLVNGTTTWGSGGAGYFGGGAGGWDRISNNKSGAGGGGGSYIAPGASGIILAGFEASPGAAADPDRVDRWTGSAVAGAGADTSSPYGYAGRIVVTLSGPAAPATIELSAATVAVTEAGTATLTVVRSGATAHTTTATWQTSPGTALAGVDFVASSGQVTFAPGATQAQIAVATVNDARFEPSESFTVDLIDVTGPGAAMGARHQSTITIADNDAPVVAFSAAGYTVTETGSVTITTRRVAGAANVPFTVAYTTASGSAVAGSDFTTTSGVLSFAAGINQRTFAVPIRGDTVREGNEAFTVRLSRPTGGATLGARSSATVTVRDND